MGKLKVGKEERNKVSFLGRKNNGYVFQQFSTESMIQFKKKNHFPYLKSWVRHQATEPCMSSYDPYLSNS